MSQLIQVRTNTSFSLNYTDNTLIPEVELIILFAQPDYIVKGTRVAKTQKIEELRIKTDANGIMRLIGELQTLQGQLTTMGNLAVGLNSFIEHNMQAAKKEGSK